MNIFKYVKYEVIDVSFLLFCREINLNSKLVVKVHGNQVNLDPFPPSSSATPNFSKPSKSSGASSSATPTLDSILSSDRGTSHKFTFDYSYWSHDRQGMD